MNPSDFSCNVIKKRQQWCFHVNFAQFLRIPFYRTPLGAVTHEDNRMFKAVMKTCLN